MVGRQVGHYRIINLLGQGGMGEVYLAEDTSLERRVAVKFLPEAFGGDLLARKRFLREARSAAALDHPYICRIFEVGCTDDGRDFIAMEYVEGRTLQARLAQGPLAVKETLKLGAELAEALDSAHGKKFIHRDLKPANIMTTPSGHLKIMDFGLAKRIAAEDGREQDLSSTLTREGATVGTLSYMAPEQIRGEPADARSDIFSLGIVLYEMVTGVHPFRRPQPIETTSAILREDPAPLDRYVDDLPELLRHTIEKMLEKEPSERYQSVHEVLTNLNRLREDSGGASFVTGWPGAAVPSAIWIGSVVAVGALAAGLTWWSLDPQEPPAERPVLRTSILLPSEFGLSSTIRSGQLLTSWREIVLSPDGRTLVFSAGEGAPPAPIKLYWRRLDRDQVSPIPGGEGGVQPFFSPDGRWIGYWVPGKLRKIPVEGGIPVDLAEVEVPPAGAFWTEDGRILLGNCRGGLEWVSAEGGTLNSLTEFNPARESRHLLPWALPGTHGILFTAMPHSYGANAWLEVFIPASGRREVLLEDAADGRYLATGHIVFLRRGRLMAAPFDLKSLKITGSPVPIEDGVQHALNMPGDVVNSGSGQFWISDAGTLVFASGGIYQDQGMELVWVDRKGTVTQVEGFDKPLLSHPALSPDGRKIVFCEKAISGALWLFDLERATHTNLLGEGLAGPPVWSPDGRQLAYSWSSAGPLNVWLMSADRKEDVRRLTQSAYDQYVCSWSADGTKLAIVESKGSNIDTLIFNLNSGRLDPFLTSNTIEWSPKFSPDGRWLAYSANETGRMEVYVTSYPTRDQTIMISSQGGVGPIWSSSSRELFYRSLDGKHFWQSESRVQL